MKEVGPLTDYPDIQKEYGINGVSPLLSLPDESVMFPRAVPYGIMHMIPLGVIEVLTKIWRGTYPFDDEVDDVLPPYVMKDLWPLFKQEMKAAGKTIPMNLSKKPMDIHNQYNSLTAHDWHNFLLLFALPLFTGRLPQRYMDNLIHFVKGYELLMSQAIKEDIIKVMEYHFRHFVQGFERLYVNYIDLHTGNLILIVVYG